MSHGWARRATSATLTRPPEAATRLVRAVFSIVILSLLLLHVNQPTVESLQYCLSCVADDALDTQSASRVPTFTRDVDVHVRCEVCTWKCVNAVLSHQVTAASVAVDLSVSLSHTRHAAAGMTVATFCAFHSPSLLAHIPSIEHPLPLVALTDPTSLRLAFHRSLTVNSRCHFVSLLHHLPRIPTTCRWRWHARQSGTMSHISSFLNAPIQPDRGRRIIPTTSLYQLTSTGDYLHDHRPLHEQVTPPVGVPNTRPQRFHRGFYRKSEAAIGVTAARQQREAEKERRGEEVGRQRLAALTARQGECEDERDLFQHKRHFLHRSTATSLAPLAPLTPPASDSPPRTPLLPPFITTSRIIGARCGREDMLGSYGVLDNFMGDGYGRSDWQPTKRERSHAGKRSGWEELSGSVSGVRGVDGLGDARRQRQVEYTRNARKGSQLNYLFGSSAERAQSV